jgi:hypothetical protein
MATAIPAESQIQGYYNYDNFFCGIHNIAASHYVGRDAQTKEPQRRFLKNESSRVERELNDDRPKAIGEDMPKDD